MGAPAVVTDQGGVSAGVSLIVPKPKIFSHIKELGAWDLSPEGSAGRLVIGWVDSVIKGGVICAVVYLHVGEGWSERNLEIIQTLGSKLVALNQPFVIMGDFNMSPEEFSQCDFLNQVNASVVAPDTVTFKQAGHSSSIDFLLLLLRWWLRVTRGLSSITTAAVPTTLFT